MRDPGFHLVTQQSASVVEPVCVSLSVCGSLYAAKMWAEVRFCVQPGCGALINVKMIMWANHGEIRGSIEANHPCGEYAGENERGVEYRACRACGGGIPRGREHGHTVLRRGAGPARLRAHRHEPRLGGLGHGQRGRADGAADAARRHEQRAVLFFGVPSVPHPWARSTCATSSSPPPRPAAKARTRLLAPPPTATHNTWPGCAQGKQRDHGDGWI